MNSSTIRSKVSASGNPLPTKTTSIFFSSSPFTLTPWHVPHGFKHAQPQSIPSSAPFFSLSLQVGVAQRLFLLQNFVVQSLLALHACSLLHLLQLPQQSMSPS